MVEVSENETWVHCPIGTLLAPVIMLDTGSEIIEPSQRFILSTYYDKFVSDDEVDFQLGADPQPISNSVRLNYRVVHKPNIRISYGPGGITSRMDNRSTPLKRIPIEHTLQIEYMGPSNRLKNVSMSVMVPVELNPEDRVGGSIPQYILYMFNEIRAPSYGNNALEWIDVRPKVIAMGRNSDQDVSKVGTCTIVNSEKVINPRGVIPMDVETFYSRKRLFNRRNNQSTLYDENIQSSFPKIPVIQFRRLQKEVFECNRVGNRIQKPICAEIICHVKELVKHRPVLIKVTGWLWARTLFAKHISDVDLVTTVSINQGDIPMVYNQLKSQLDIFTYHKHFLSTNSTEVNTSNSNLANYCWCCIRRFFRRRKTQLRKAMLTKGGAEETYKREQTESLLEGQTKPLHKGYTHDRVDYTNSTPLTSTQSQPSIYRNDTSTGKKLKKKHKKDLNILHPGDLSGTTPPTNGRQHHQQQYKEPEEQNLITDSTSSQ
ncbi:unnamed protein product [Heterobilharzia americana]|nr:unnamed protein product [Heterobilharzia americana]